MNFSTSIIRWYGFHKRDLPWRETRDPYRIWLSEIILQQTRVDQGMAYYHKFVKNYPSVEDLANASQDEVLKDWQGLGYYSRARNLHYAANQVMQEFNGGFPNNYHDILKLKGVGEYTAAAISSFAFDEAQAVIDGNVMRVLSRFFGVTDAIDSKEGKAQLVKLSKEHLNQKDPATHNQAIMEFGALQCTPVSPDCSNCPLAKGCFALANEMVADLPWKEKKTVVKPMHIAYAVFINEDSILMKQRKGEGIWEGLFDFPSIVSEAPIDTQQAAQQMLQTRDWKDTLLSEVSEEVTHILSHRKIKARFFRINVLHKPHNIQNGEKWLTKSELAEKGIPRLIENYLKEIDWYE